MKWPWQAMSIELAPIHELFLEQYNIHVSEPCVIISHISRVLLLKLFNNSACLCDQLPTFCSHCHIWPQPPIFVYDQHNCWPIMSPTNKKKHCKLKTTTTSEPSPPDMTLLTCVVICDSIELADVDTTYSFLATTTFMLESRNIELLWKCAY